MLHPTLTLWRHHRRVAFYDCSASRGSPDIVALDIRDKPAMAQRRRWASQDEALHYLRYWIADGAAVAELALLLARARGPVAGPRRSAEDVLVGVAARLVAGDVVVVEESLRPGTPSRLAPAPTATAAAAVAAAAPLARAPAVPSAQALLPALETVQIEGAEVRPELEDALADLNRSIAKVGDAGASVDPAPSSVADIRAALGQSTTSSASELEQM